MTEELFTFPRPAEFRRRTWYGRVKMLPDAIAWVIMGPVLVAFIATIIVIIATIALVPLAYYRAKWWLSALEPEVYKDGN